MRHNPTSWNSHRSPWRWTAGQDGRSPAGGQARWGGGRPALARQKAIGEHDACEVPMQAIPPPPLVVVQATRACGVLVALRDGPTAVRQCNQAGPRRVRRAPAVRPLRLTLTAGHGALAEQPALWPG